MNEAIEPNSIQDFNQRFYDLAIEADSYGISSVFGLVESDRINLQDTAFFGYRGGRYVSIGLADMLKKDLTSPRSLTFGDQGDEND